MTEPAPDPTPAPAAAPADKKARTKQGANSESYTWTNLWTNIPWTDQDAKDTAKAAIEAHATTVGRLSQDKQKKARDTYAEEFVKDNDWIPQARRKWTRACIARLLSGTHRNTTRDRKVKKEQQDGPEDGGHGSEDAPDNNTTNENASEGDDVNKDIVRKPSRAGQQLTRKTFAFARPKLDRPNRSFLTYVGAHDNGFTDRLPKRSYIRIVRIVSGGEEIVTRIGLWLCIQTPGGQGSTGLSTDSMDLSFSRLRELAELSESEILSYPDPACRLGYIRIRNDAEFITGIQQLLDDKTRLDGDLVLYVSESEGEFFLLHDWLCTNRKSLRTIRPDHAKSSSEIATIAGQLAIDVEYWIHGVRIK